MTTVLPKVMQQDVHSSASEISWSKNLTLMIKLPDLTPSLQGIPKITENMLKKKNHEDTIGKILDVT